MDFLVFDCRPEQRASKPTTEALRHEHTEAQALWNRFWTQLLAHTNLWFTQNKISADAAELVVVVVGWDGSVQTVLKPPYNVQTAHQLLSGAAPIPTSFEVAAVTLPQVPNPKDEKAPSSIEASDPLSNALNMCYDMTSAAKKQRYTSISVWTGNTRSFQLHPAKLQALAMRLSNKRLKVAFEYLRPVTDQSDFIKQLETFSVATSTLESVSCAMYRSDEISMWRLFQRRLPVSSRLAVLELKSASPATSAIAMEIRPLLVPPAAPKGVTLCSCHGVATTEGLFSDAEKHTQYCPTHRKKLKPKELVPGVEIAGLTLMSNSAVIRRKRQPSSQPLRLVTAKRISVSTLSSAHLYGTPFLVTPPAFRLNEGVTSDEANFRIAVFQALVRTLIETDQALLIQSDTNIAADMNDHSAVAFNKPITTYYLLLPDIESPLQAILQQIATREFVRVTGESKTAKIVLPDSLTAEVKTAFDALPLSDYNPLEMMSGFHSCIADLCLTATNAATDPSFAYRPLPTAKTSSPVPPTAGIGSPRGRGRPRKNPLPQTVKPAAAATATGSSVNYKPRPALSLVPSATAGGDSLPAASAAMEV